MKNFQAHLAAVSLPYEDFEEDATATPAKAVEEVHPLAAELRQALENPAGTSIGTYAHLVERLLGELSVGDAELDAIGDPVTPRLAGSLPKRPYVPMTPEEEQRSAASRPRITEPRITE
jgi:hypothetical protein